MCVRAAWNKTFVHNPSAHLLRADWTSSDLELKTPHYQFIYSNFRLILCVVYYICLLQYGPEGWTMKQVWQAFFKLAGLATLQSVIKTMKKASGSGQAQITEGMKCFFWLYFCEKLTVLLVELTVIYHIFWKSGFNFTSHICVWLQPDPLNPEIT